MSLDPLSIPWHTAFWASDPGWTPPADGGSVSSWHDASGNSRTASQATGSKQPLYRAAVTALGSRPAVEFDGVDDFLQTAAFGSNIGQPATVVVIAKLLALRTTGAAVSVMNDGITSTDRMIVADQAIVGGVTEVWRMFAGSNQDGGTSDTSPHLFIGEFNSAANDTLRLDGSIITNAEAGSQSLTGVTLGARFDGTTTNANAQIAFYGHIARVLTTTERVNLDSWAQDFYGITNSDYQGPAKRVTHYKTAVRRAAVY